MSQIRGLSSLLLLRSVSTFTYTSPAATALSSLSTPHPMSNNEPAIRKLNGPEEALPLISSFSALSAGTEMASYKDPQWKFLLSGGDVSAHTLQSENGALDGCVAKIQLDGANFGLGMVLVDPKHRGKGYAKALINDAMQSADDENTRCVLAVCTALGQPVYRKLGFQEAGIISSLTCPVSALMEASPQKIGNGQLAVRSGKVCSASDLKLLADLDAKAVGISRKDRLQVLTSGAYAESEGSRSTVAFLGDDAAAVARQDCDNGPLIVGPIIGKEEMVLPLVHALVTKHFEGQETNSICNISVQMLIVDHPNLVRALESKGMGKVWENPAMTSDGKSVYYKGNGSYLAMMHPTLG